MKTIFLSILFLFGFQLSQAQPWQGQVGINLATLPGHSLEIATAWSPDLNRGAFTFNAGYTYQNHFSATPSGLLCDCGLHDVSTSGAFVKAGYRRDVIRSFKSHTKIGFPIGLVVIGSQYQQEGTIHSFSDGQSRYSTQSAQGFIVGMGLTAAMNIRLASRWNLDLGVQKFIALQKRTDYLLFADNATHQPGIGLTNWKNFWPGLQGIVTLNYRLKGL